MSGDKNDNGGLCLVCARELGIKPVDDLMKKMGIEDEDLEAMSDQMTGLMNMDFDSMKESLEEAGPDDSEQDTGSFEPGGAATFNMFKKIFGSAEPKKRRRQRSKIRPDNKRTTQTKGKRKKEKISG